MQISRDDIIIKYRQRIEQNTWSKLSKKERTALAEAFIDMLGYCQSEEDCRLLCEAEIALLEEGYPQNSIANQYYQNGEKRSPRPWTMVVCPKWRYRPMSLANITTTGRLSI